MIKIVINFIISIKKRRPGYPLHHNLVNDYLRTLFFYPWAQSIILNNHQECWFKKQYTIEDVQFEECKCNAYFFNYLTCIFQEIADNCPDKQIKSTADCISRFKGIEKNKFWN